MQTFFDELKNGTRNYRTVASLSGQITQEYRGRCVLELLQNAHDALANAAPGDPRQISFAFAAEPEPVLLIANSGRPFLREDFEGICQLGQSPKDPNESVGNKGLGFQSVLEVSTRPQIWSTTAPGINTAFAFRFDPDGAHDLVEQALGEIEASLGSPTPPTGPARRIIDWSQEQLDQYRHRVSNKDAAGEARKYLSPYSIPLPIADMPPQVEELLGEGHSTVIRLPLDGGRTGTHDEANEAVGSIERQLDQLDATSTVFLPHLEKLTIETDGQRRVLERVVDSAADLPGSRPTRQQLVLVGRSADGARNDATREFRVWTRSLGDDSTPEEAQRIQDVVRHLPNRWPEVRQVEVGVAVEDTASPERGVFVIFLPTEEATGTGAHINAPFYGSLDRRQINFDDEYNALLLEFVMDLCLDVAAQLVTGPAEGWRARAVVDLLASTGPPPAGGRPALMDQIRQRAEDQHHDLENTDLILCDDGWQGGGSARIMPDVPEDDLIGEDRWRENANFAVVSSELDGRDPAVETLLERLGGSSSPTPPEWANTVERLAARIGRHDIEATWDDFLTSLLAVLP